MSIKSKTQPHDKTIEFTTEVISALPSDALDLLIDNLDNCPPEINGQDILLRTILATKSEKALEILTRSKTEKVLIGEKRYLCEEMLSPSKTVSTAEKILQEKDLSLFKDIDLISRNKNIH